MKDLAELEKERNIRPSPEIDAFMKVVDWNLNFITLIDYSRGKKKTLNLCNREFLHGFSFIPVS